MKNKISSLSVLLGLALILPSLLSAAKGGSGAPLLMMDSFGARAMALNDAFTGLADDINTVSVNPAGLAGLSAMEFSTMYLNYPEGMTFGHLAAGFPIGKGGYAALSVGYFHLTPFDQFDVNGLRLEEALTASDIAVTASWGRRIVPGSISLDAGIGLKAMRSSLAGTAALGFAGDAGILLKSSVPYWGEDTELKNNLGLGIVIQNLGTSLVFLEEKTSLPMNLRAGIAYSFYKDQFVLLTATGDGNLPNDADPTVSAGLEAILFDRLALRGGYQVLGAETRTFSAGIGVSQPVLGRTLKADVAYLPLTALGHQISVSLGMKL